MEIVLYHLRKILEKEQERIFLWIPVVFAAGILFYFSLTSEPSLWWSLVVVEGLIVWAYIRRGNPSLLMFIGWLAVFVLGFINIQARAYHLSHIPLLDNEETLYIKGYVSETGYNYRGKQYLILDKMRDFDDRTITGKYRITPLNAKNKITAGDCVEAVAMMRPLMPPTMSDAYQFNRKQYFEGLKATGYTDVAVYKINCADINVRPDLFLPRIENIRENIVQKISALLPPETAGIAAAVIAGDRSKITTTQTENYRDAGLAHFLAISGLHMGMIAGLTFLIVRSLAACVPIIALRYDTKKIAAVVAIMMSFVYLLISGGQISTRRAFIMTFLLLTGVLFGRRAISMRMIAWAALFILIFEPQVIISAGFQMSFAAVTMLTAFYERYAGKFRFSRHGNIFSNICGTVLLYLMGIVVADFIASTATLPFAIYHFNRISLYTCLANLAAGPIIGLWIMPAVLFSLLLMPFSAEKYALYAAGKGIEIVNFITERVSGLEYASYRIVSMPDWGLFMIVAGGLWLAIWQGRWRHGGWLFVILGFLSVLTVRMPDVLTDNGAKTFAVRDNNGKMVILPNRGNYFTKKMWAEKLALSSLTEEDKNKLRAIYKGEREDKNWLALRCDEIRCVYKDNVILYKDGGLEIAGKDYSDVGALAVYETATTPIVKTVRQTLGRRYWNL